MQPQERHALREDFIEAFVHQLILNAYDPNKDETFQQPQKEKTDTSEQQTAQGMPMLNLAELQPKDTLPSLPASMMLPNLPSRKSPQLQMKMPLSQPMPQLNAIPLPQETYHPPPLKPGQHPDTVNLGKIASFLVDPAVFSVECQGPYKNLLVNRGGSLQTSQISLTPEEIEAIMQNVSNKTRIPLTSGVFKAAVQDLVVTAVVSEFVGTRFLIQKRMPFQRY